MLERLHNINGTYN